jgi:hypothetical protein
MKGRKKENHLKLERKKKRENHHHHMINQKEEEGEPCIYIKLQDFFFCLITLSGKNFIRKKIKRSF